MPEISEEELQALKDAKAKADALEANKTRLEEEAKKFKERAQSAEGKLSKAEEEKLQAEGKTQELLDKEKLRAKELEDKLNSTRKATLQEKLRSEVSKFAKDAHDVDMIIRVQEHKALLKLDEENLAIQGVEEFVNAVKGTHDYLFGKKAMPEGEGGGKPGTGNPPDPMAGKSEEEKFRAELKTVSSRKEQMEVYKKYGKSIDSFMNR